MLMGNSHVTWDYHIIILMFNVGDSYHDSQWGLSVAVMDNLIV